MADQISEQLCSTAKIERDKGVHALEEYLIAASDSGIRDFEVRIQNLLCSKDDPWEPKHGALLAAKAMLSLSESRRCSDEFVYFIETTALILLEHSESRIRLAAGEVVGALCSRNGVHVYTNIKSRILDGIQSNLERKPLTEAEISEQQGTEKLLEKLTSSQPERKRRNSADAEQIFHDTAGWKSLETWMKCLQFSIDGCGQEFNPFVDAELLELIFQTLTHTNRFVRETGYYVLGALVNCNTPSNGAVSSVSIEDNAVYRHGEQFAKQLAIGLADNWSQVRLASSVASRQFLLGLPTEEARHCFYPALLPALCLNRYYVAEGVRIYNQKTWASLTGGHGVQLVEAYIRDVVDFYVLQSDADNHAVREAACACIAELGAKIDKDTVRPYVPRLLEALIVCFKDESWPVRDASCVACGNFVICFPEESRSSMGTLYGLFFENLADNIASVRQGAAIALANVVKAYGQEASQVVLDKVKQGLEGVASQPENTQKYSDLDTGPATFGVVKRLRDNDMELHTDRQMYSCGSLAPKMHKGTREGGCMDHKFRRPPEPWELAEGCVHIVGELSQQASLAQEIAKLLPLVAKASSYRHYTQHVHFLETVCKVLPAVGKGIGKRMFKMTLEYFYDAIFYSVSCDNALTSSAAAQCLSETGKLIGPNILRGRIEQYDPRFLQYLDSPGFLPP